MFCLYLIPCSHPCAHQKEGYCTLQSLHKTTSRIGGDCIYFQEASTEQPPKFLNRTDAGQLQPGIMAQADRFHIVGRQDHPPEA